MRIVAGVVPSLELASLAKLPSVKRSAVHCWWCTEPELPSLVLEMLGINWGAALADCFRGLGTRLSSLVLHSESARAVGKSLNFHCCIYKQ